MFNTRIMHHHNRPQSFCWLHLDTGYNNAERYRSTSLHGQIVDPLAWADITHIELRVYDTPAWLLCVLVHIILYWKPASHLVHHCLPSLPHPRYYFRQTKISSSFISSSKSSWEERARASQRSRRAAATAAAQTSQNPVKTRKAQPLLHLLR